MRGTPQSELISPLVSEKIVELSHLMDTPRLAVVVYHYMNTSAVARRQGMAERERGGAECEIEVYTINIIHRSNTYLRRKYPSIWRVVS